MIMIMRVKLRFSRGFDEETALWCAHQARDKILGGKNYWFVIKYGNPSKNPSLYVLHDLETRKFFDRSCSTSESDSHPEFVCSAFSPLAVNLTNGRG